MLVWILYFVVLLSVSIHDIRYYKVSNIAHLALILLAIAMKRHLEHYFIYDVVFAVAFVVLLLVITASANCIGGGDIKFIASNIVFLGFYKSCLALVIGCIIMVVYSKLKKIRAAIPMLPYLSFGNLCVCLVAFIKNI